MSRIENQKNDLTKDEIEQSVRSFYEDIAQGKIVVREEVEKLNESLGYSKEDLDKIPEEAKLGLGCGNPFEMREVQPGEIVLDLGSGRGMDAFLAARNTGETGKVYGVDNNEEMIRRAKEISDKRGFENTEFVESPIEELPFEDEMMDLVISNCVINLSTEKQKVYDEIYRVLKKGGEFSISDIILKNPLPEEILKDPNMYGT